MDILYKEKAYFCWNKMKRETNSFEETAKPSWIDRKFYKAYNPGTRFLPHLLRYSYATSALQECQIRYQQNGNITNEQKFHIEKQLQKDRRNFIAFEIVGYVGTALNFATFVPLLVQAISV